MRHLLSIEDLGADGIDEVLRLTVVPEPACLAVWGGVALCLRRRGARGER